jgi:acetyltransferase-like isoleucine patch superfamily enzyme
MKRIVAWLGRLVGEQRLRNKFPDSVIHGGAMADASSVLGKYSVLFKDAYLSASTLGGYSYVQSGSVINNAEIGPYCSIAGGVTIGLAMHPTSMVSTSPVFYDNTQPLPRFFVKTQLFSANMPRTIVEADVWIGQGVFVKAGVRIGVGAVIGAGAVVTKDVAPYMIAAGNPCRAIRARFAAETCQKLLDSRWWELDDAMLQEMGRYFYEPDYLCEQLTKIRARPKK